MDDDNNNSSVMDDDNITDNRTDKDKDKSQVYSNTTENKLIKRIEDIYDNNKANTKNMIANMGHNTNEISLSSEY